MGTFWILVSLIIFVCILLVLVVMVQNPKGGGLSSTFGGGQQQIGGVKSTTDFLDKSTWALATLLLALILASNIAIGGSEAELESKALDPESTTTAPAEDLPAEAIPLTNEVDEESN